MAKKLDSIQILRAVAAISVVAVHAVTIAARSFAPQAAHTAPAHFRDFHRLGSSGVDIFFVISGFVMMYVHYDQFGDRNAPRQFFARRMIRVVPLYWLLTGITIVLIIFAPWLSFDQGQIDLPWMVGSFLFIQIPTHSGYTQPVVAPGWTLNFEMFFYAIFAFSLLMPRRLAIRFIAGIFGALLIIGLAFPDRPVWLTVWTGPLLLEFLAGVVLAIAYRRALPIFSAKIGPFLIALGVALLAMTVWSTPPWKGWLQAFEWGIPATLIVWGTLSIQLNPSWRVSLGKLLGDASYSIYLFQVVALPVLALVLKLALREHKIPVNLAAGILIFGSIAVSVGCWYIIERPMTRYFTGLLLKRESMP